VPKVRIKLIYSTTTNYLYLIGEPPDIDEGSFDSQPNQIANGTMRVKIGTPVNVVNVFNVIIDCNIINGTLPINFTWSRNGSPYPTEGNVSTITITDASDGDVFTCRAANIMGSDMKSTTITKEGTYLVNYI